MSQALDKTKNIYYLSSAGRLVNSSNKIHELKTWPKFFQAIIDGLKTFEIRNNDRGFNIGDWLRLREYCQQLDQYTNREVTVIVTYIAQGEVWGAKTESVVMGFRNVIGGEL